LGHGTGLDGAATMGGTDPRSATMPGGSPG